jgi:hypothetical protein
MISNDFKDVFDKQEQLIHLNMEMAFKMMQRDESKRNVYALSSEFGEEENNIGGVSQGI